jgi:hypothetical protein
MRNYQKLFNYFSKEHDIDLLQTEMQEVFRIVNENQTKLLLFAAYLQGKRDQIIWNTKYEELAPIGKYRVAKQFLKWVETKQICK